MTPEDFIKLIDDKQKKIEEFDMQLSANSVNLNISALSILNAIRQHDQERKGNNLYLYNHLGQQPSTRRLQDYLPPQDEEETVGQKDFAILYIEGAQCNNKKLVALMDSGADLSLITMEYLKTVLSIDEINENMAACKSGMKQMASYSNNALKVIGRVKLKCAFSPHPRVSKVDLYLQVIEDDNVFYPFLVGKDILRRLLIDITHEKTHDGQIEALAIAKYPENYDFPIIVSTVADLNKISKHLHIKAGETKVVHLSLPENHHFNVGDKILVTYLEDDGLSSVPSLNTLTEDNDLFITISNLTFQDIHRDIHCICEIIPAESMYYQVSATLAPGTKVVVPVLPRSNYHKGPSHFSMHQALPNDIQRVKKIQAFNINNIQSADPSNHMAPDYNKIDINTVPYEAELSEERSNTHHEAFGYEKSEFLSVEEVVQIDQFPAYMQEHIRRIFVEKYPSIVSRSSLDLGDISQTLGKYTIELKPGQKLPSFKKLYYLGPEERRMMTDLVGFLIKYGVLERVDNRMLDGDFNSKFFSPAYVISKKDPESSGRLIIDYSTLNSIIQTRPPCIPEINTILHSLRDCVFLTSLDVSSAFYSVQLSENSKAYTRFISPLGVVEMTRLPMGFCGSPAVFDSFAQRILHYKAKRDADGQLVYENDGVLSMEYDPLPNCYVFYDDFIIASKLQSTFEKSMQAHFEILDKVASRLAFHSAKIAFQKSKICKSKIKFLGWEISFNRICPDRSRVERLLETKMPDSKKALRSFLGLVNTLRQCLNQEFIEQMQVLSPLTSAIREYVVEDKHIKAFEEIKRLLTTSEIFVNIISVHTQKVLFTDSSDDAFSGVLCQIAENLPDQPYLPPYLGLNNPVHQQLYDLRLEYVPVPLYLHSETLSRSEFKEEPLAQLELAHYYELPLCGYKEEHVQDSLFYAVRSIQYAYGCKLTPIVELRESLGKILGKSIVGHQIKDFSFNNNIPEYKAFVANLKNGTGGLDPKLYILYVLHSIIRRRCIFIATAPLPNGDLIMETGEEYLTPPFVFGIYHREGKVIFTPYYQDKNVEYNLENFKKRLEICAFYSKAVSPAERPYSIFEKEVLALVNSLDHYRKLIGHSKLMVLVDNKSLYLCLSRKLQAHYPKLHRWALRIQFLFPQLMIKFVRSGRNLADFLSRSFSTRLRDIKRIPLKRYHVAPEISEYIDFSRIYTLEEFQDFVDQHEAFLLASHSEAEIKHGVAALTKLTQTMTETLKPLNIIQQRMEHENVRMEQKLQFKEEFEQCMMAENFHFKTDKAEFKIQHGLLYVKHSDEFLVCLPDSLIGLFLSYLHVAYGHCGMNKMISLLYPYHFPHKYDIVAKFLRSCYSCFLNSGTYRQDFLASFYVPEYSFESVHCDLIESLPPQQKYAHIFVMVCPLSNLLLTFPIRLKTTETILYILRYMVFPIFNVKCFLSDAGSLFTSKKFRAALNALNIQKIDIARLAPSHNGLAEVTIRYFKSGIKKYLASKDHMNWLPYVPILTKVHNLTRANKSKLTPLQLLFGNGPHTISPWETKLLPEHKLLTNSKAAIEAANVERNKLVTLARTHIEESDKIIKKRLNKNRVKRKFKVGQIVHTLDRRVLPGNTRSLAPLYNTDLYVVLRPLVSSTVIQHIGSGMRFYYKNADLKAYHPYSNTISVPSELRPYLSLPIESWEEEVFALIRKHSKFPILTKAVSLATTEEIETLVNDKVNFQPIEIEFEREIRQATSDLEDSDSDTDENDVLMLPIPDQHEDASKASTDEVLLDRSSPDVLEQPPPEETGEKSPIENAIHDNQQPVLESTAGPPLNAVGPATFPIHQPDSASPHEVTDQILQDVAQSDGKYTKTRARPKITYFNDDNLQHIIQDLPPQRTKRKKKTKPKQAESAKPKHNKLRPKENNGTDSDEAEDNKTKTVTFDQTLNISEDREADAQDADTTTSQN